MNYTEIVTEWANLAAYATDDEGFVANLPTAIAYAEERITRELDLMAANITDATELTTANSRIFNLPTTYGTFLILFDVNVITPASVPAASGTRTPLVPASQAVLDTLYGSSTGAGVPQYYCWVTQNTTTVDQPQLILAPWPDDTYRMEIVGRVQPGALSASNTTTWLSINLPALYIAAGMIQISGFMRNYGAQADDVRQAMSWEQQYVTLRDSAVTYQARARFGGASWTSKPLEPMAQPQRG